MTTLTNIDEAALEAFRSDSRGELLRPGDAEYDAARALYNAMIDKHPGLIARCMGLADVVAAVRFGREQSLEVAVRGGGHNVAGKALCDDGLVIDLSRMRTVHVDPVARTARAQGGATWAEYDRETHVFGLASTGGFVSSTGIAGLTLGGGLGWLMRAYGLALDNLRSVEMVLADGSVVTASESEHPDLFWAVRGAGHNFGVVTSFEYRVHPLATLLGGMVVHPLERAPEAFRFLRDAMRTAPDQLLAQAGLLYTPDGVPVCAFFLAYAGPVEDGERVLAPLRAFGPPLADMVMPQPYPKLQTMLDEGFPFGLQNYWKSSFIPTLTDEAIDTAVAVFKDATSPLAGVLFEGLGGAVNRVRADATAFSHRSSDFNLVIVGRWTEPAEAERHMGWVRRLWNEMQPYAADEVYVNYIAADEDDRIQQAYGPNYQRLASIKARYDPTNFFRGNQNIIPSG